MKSCAHRAIDTPIGRLRLLLAPTGLRCRECHRVVRLKAKIQVRGLGLIVVLPVLLGVLFHSGMAGGFSGVAAFMSIMGISDKPRLTGALREDGPDGDPIQMDGASRRP